MTIAEKLYQGIVDRIPADRIVDRRGTNQHTKRMRFDDGSRIMLLSDAVCWGDSSHMLAVKTCSKWPKR